MQLISSRQQTSPPPLFLTIVLQPGRKCSMSQVLLRKESWLLWEERQGQPPTSTILQSGRYVSASGTNYVANVLIPESQH